MTLHSLISPIWSLGNLPTTFPSSYPIQVPRAHALTFLRPAVTLHRPVECPAANSHMITNMPGELLTPQKPVATDTSQPCLNTDALQEFLTLETKALCTMIGPLLQRLRAEQKLTQEQLATGLCARSHISQVENGITVPSVELLTAFAYRLGIDLAALADAYIGASPSPCQALALVRRLAVEGNPGLAQSVYEKTQRRLGNDINSRLSRKYAAELVETKGVIELKKGSPEAAIEMFMTAESIATPTKTTGARIQLRLGLTALQLNELPLARESLLKAFRTILWINPEESKTKTETVISLHRQIAMNLGITLLRQRDIHTAWMVLESASDAWQEYGILQPWPPELLMVRALTEMGTGRFNEAQKSLKEILQTKAPPGTTASALHNLGLLCRLEGNLDKAQENIQQAWDLYVTQDAGNPQAICNELARCALEKGQKSAVTTWLTRAEGFAENCPDSMVAIDTILLRAKEALANDKPALAQDYLERIEGFENISPAHRKLLWIEQARLAAALDDGDTVNRKLDLLERELTPEVL